MTDGDRRSTDWILVLDSATSRVVVAAGDGNGRVIAERSFAAEHRHGERLLATVEELARSEGLGLHELRGIVVGTGPGAFTGLRVGLATAKTLAHELHVPIAGVSTGRALVRAAGAAAPVWLPAGPQDRVEVTPDGPPRLVPAGVATETSEHDGVAAVDLEGRASPEALARGRGRPPRAGAAAGGGGVGAAAARGSRPAGTTPRRSCPNT